jgi:hypothetical protein
MPRADPDEVKRRSSPMRLPSLRRSRRRLVSRAGLAGGGAPNKDSYRRSFFRAVGIKEADGPNLPRLQRALRTDFPSCVPCTSVGRCGIKLRHTHDCSPAAGMARGETGRPPTSATVVRRLSDPSPSSSSITQMSASGCRPGRPNHRLWRKPAVDSASLLRPLPPRAVILSLARDTFGFMETIC